jgi:UDP-N-acetylglucosamine enolpyruvyl transferase
MTAVLPATVERARKTYLTVLQRLQEPGTATAVAVAMGSSESTISRLKNEHMETLCAVLAHLGLKVVPVEMQCFKPEMVQALLTVSRAHLDTIQTVDQLSWD